MMNVIVKRVYYSCVDVLGINPQVKTLEFVPQKAFTKNRITLHEGIHNTTLLLALECRNLLTNSTFHYMPYWTG